MQLGNSGQSTESRRKLRRFAPLLIGATAGACCIAAVAIVGSGLLSGVSLSAASAPATASHWQNVVSRQLVARGVLAARQSLDLPTGPPGNPSPRATLELVQGDVGTPNSLGQQLASWRIQAVPGGIAAVNAVDSVSRTAIWAVGAHCTILFSANGTTWTRDTAVSGCTADTSLNGVSVLGPAGPGWAVGSNGTILVCSAACDTATAVWSALKPGSSVPPPSSVTFTSVWGADRTHVYAVGDDKIWACSAACRVTAVGGPGNAAWMPLTPAGLSDGNTLASVEGSGRGLAVAVGSGGTILVCTTHCASSGAGWSALGGGPVPSGDTNFTGVYASDPRHVYAVGDSAIWGCSAACTMPVSGSGVSAAKWANLVPSFSLPNLVAVAAAAPNGPAWAVGQAGALWFCGALCTRSGTSWVPIVSRTANAFRGIAVANPSHAWAVGDEATIVAQLNPTDTQSRIASGTASLGAALAPGLWVDDYHVAAFGLNSDNQGRTQGVFDNAELAARQLIRIKPSPPAWAVTDMDWLDYATQLLAKTAIDDNSQCPRKPARLTAAKHERAAGDAAYRSGHYDTAIAHYKDARRDAVKADGSSCPDGGITVTPSGAPAFSLLDMVPGDSSATETITVTNTGTASPLVVLYEQNVVDGGLLSGEYPLQLNIVEDGWRELYSGPLASGWTGSGKSYLNLRGSSGDEWATGEAHTFVFTVSWSPLAGNTYRNKTASLNFVWARG